MSTVIPKVDVETSSEISVKSTNKHIPLKTYRLSMGSRRVNDSDYYPLFLSVDGKTGKVALRHEDLVSVVTLLLYAVDGKQIDEQQPSTS